MIEISTLSLRVVRENTQYFDIDSEITSAQEMYEVFEKALDMSNRSEEIFAIATLDTKNKITGIFQVAQGSLSSVSVHPREVFKRAITHNAYSIFLVHNHLSGDTSPSSEDFHITNRLKEVGNLLGIKVLDHIIISGGNHVSFKNLGYI